MKRAFLESLIDNGAVAPQVAAKLRGRLRAPGDPIGAIALRNGVLRETHIDAILIEQGLRYRPFGEIAIELGLLSNGQVDDILFVQRVSNVTTVVEALIVAGRCSREEILHEMVQFLPMTKTASPIARERVWSVLTNSTD